jgi:PAS domain S-box-containing protein
MQENDGRSHRRQGEPDFGLVLLDALPIGLYAVDPDLRVVAWNRLRELGPLGRPRSDTLGRSLRDVLPAEGLQATLPTIERVFQTGQRLEEFVERPHATYHVWRLPVHQGGAVTHVVSLFEDVTAERRTVDALRHSQETLRTVLTSAPVILWAVDREGRFTLCEGLALSALGLRPADVVGRSAFDEGGDYAAFIADVRRALAGESISNVVEASGAVLETRSAPVHGPDGNVTGAIGVAMNVTERSRAEEKLRFQAHLLESVMHGLVAVDLDWRVQYWNRAAEAIQGASAGEVLGRDLRDCVMTAETRVEIDGAFARLVSGGTWSGEVALRKADGSYFPALLTLSPIPDPAGACRAFIGHFMDVTERKSLEARLLQSQKMEAVGQLAGGIAHDFNNLLSVVLGYAELLGRALGPQHRDLGRVDEIRKAAERAAGLTRQLLAFSRKQILQPRMTDLNAVVADMEAMLRRLIGEHIDLVTAKEPALGSVKVDPGQMEQVIMNLAVNARDAMPGGGKLILETANVELNDHFCRFHPGFHAGPYVLLAVSDTGHGIPAAALPHIFEPFFTTKEQGEGTGLGLSTAYGIVQQSGGQIAVYSEPGLGTTFKIYLPRVDGAAEPLRPGREEQPARGTETILLVEDEESLRGMIREILEEAGYSVIEGASPEAALGAIQERTEPIDVLVTDVVLPRMSGSDVARALRSRWPGARVIFMSGYTAEGIGHHRVIDPATPFLQKPFTSATLLSTLRRVCDGLPP